MIDYENSYMKRILTATEEEDMKKRAELISEGMQNYLTRFTEVVNENFADAPLALAALKVSAIGLENVIPDSGVELANEFVTTGIFTSGPKIRREGDGDE